MGVIELTQGQVVIVDDSDVCWLSEYKWHAQWDIGKRQFVACGRVSGRKIEKMHRVIMTASVGDVVDHINRVSLDNRRCNLRICTRAQNDWNRGIGASNKSGYKGVCWLKTDRKWRAYITANGVCHVIGRFDSAEDAALAYNRAATKLHGTFAVLNDVSKITKVIF